MDKKKVALFVAVGIGSISILGGITYFARKLWYGKSNSVQKIKTELEKSEESEVLEQVPLKNETEMKTISKYEALEASEQVPLKNETEMKTISKYEASEQNLAID